MSWYPPNSADENGKPVDGLLPKLLGKKIADFRFRSVFQLLTAATYAPVVERIEWPSRVKMMFLVLVVIITFSVKHI